MTMRHRGKVLVLGGDNRAFLAVVRSLGRQDIEVHAGWSPRPLSALRSRYLSRVHELPAYGEDQAWLAGLTDLMDREQFDLVIPCDDPSVLLLQLHRREMEPHGRCYLLPERAFEVAFDKASTHELARSLDIPVPAQVTVEPGGEAAETLGRLHFPVVVKAPVSCSPENLYYRQRARTARTPEQAARAIGQSPVSGPLLVQEHFPGRGMGVEVLVHEGRPLMAFQHERIHEPIRGGGSTYRRSVPLSPSLMEAVEQLVGALDYSGVLMAEFRVQPRTGWWVLLELNARFWGSLPLAVAAGADFPFCLYEMLVEGRRDFESGYKTGLYCRNVKK
ncbi:MAG: ATP-grasp domain-containing protein, partial [Candidatus Brocadiia bacterium]